MLRGSTGERSLHKPLHECRGNGDAEPIDDHAVDADKATLGVDEGPARVSWSKTDIGNDPAGVAVTLVTRDTVYHAHRERIVYAEWVSMREHQLSGAE
jgi:hypothetical protein